MDQASAVTSGSAGVRAPTPMVQHPGWHARLALRFDRRGARTVLGSRTHSGPLVVQRPLYETGEAVCQVVIVHPPGGIAGGDHLTIEATASEGAHALFTTPGAAKWYRSAGPWAAQALRIQAGRDAVVEWLPQETIVFEAARARMRSRIQLDAGALFIGWDVLCFGRTASGERFARGELAQTTEVVVSGRPVFAEFAQVAGGSPLLTAPAGLAGYPVSATMLIAGREIEADLLAALRGAVPPAQTLAGVSALPGVTVARILAHSAEAARSWLTALWKLARPALTHAAPVPPRIWRC
jgi:urease accessory protein